MVEVARVHAALAERRSGFSLPQAFYIDPELYEADLEAIFANDWIFACNGCEIPRPGDYLTLQVGRGSVIVLRNRDGQLRAFHNTCRHRGSRICLKEKGRVTRLTCPYHHWTYDLDGMLRYARQMPADFNPRDHGLAPVAIEVICGMAYICLAATPPRSVVLQDCRHAVHRTPPADRVKIAHQTTLIENANWKLVIENNRECYHCTGNHPELLATLVEFALPVMHVVGVAVVGAANRDDPFEGRRSGGGDLQSVEGAPGKADHTDRTAAPRLGRDPGDDVPRVAPLGGRVFVGHRAVGIASPSHVHAYAGEADCGEAWMEKGVIARGVDRGGDRGDVRERPALAMGHPAATGAPRACSHRPG